MQLSVIQSHYPYSTNIKLQNFKMSSLDDRFLLIQASFGVNNNYTGGKITNFYSKLNKLIASFEHMFDLNQISSLDNYVEDDRLSEITKLTSKTKPSKSDPSSF